MSSDDPETVEGVDFTNVNETISEIEYPISAGELVDRYGDRELERTNADPISIEELFDHMGDNTFESEEGLRTMLIGQMPRDTTGRENYSDRGGSLPEQTDAAEEAADQTAADVENGVSTDTDTTQQ